MLSKLFLYTFRDSGQDRAESNVQDKYDRDFRDIKQLDPTLPPTRLEDWKKPCIMAHFMLHNQNKEIFDEWKRRQLSFLLIQEVTGGICQKNIFTGTKTLNLKHTDTFLKLCKMHDSYSSGGSSSSSSSSSRK